MLEQTEMLEKWARMFAYHDLRAAGLALEAMELMRFYALVDGHKHLPEITSELSLVVPTLIANTARRLRESTN